MKETTNQFSLVGDKFMLEIQLRQPGFSFSVCRLFSKNKEPIQKFKETGGSNYIYQNKLDKVCFQHDMAYEDFKYLPKRTIADKISCDKAFNIAKNPKNDGCQRGLGSMVYKFFDKNSSNTNKGTGINSDVVSESEELANELHKPLIKKFKKRKLHSPFMGNMCGADLPDM